MDTENVHEQFDEDEMTRMNYFDRGSVWEDWE